MRGRFLTRKEYKQVNDRLEEAFGARLPEDLIPYAVRERKDRYDLHLLSRDAAKLPLEEIREVTAGLYVAEVTPRVVRPSVEGSMLLAKRHATRILQLPEALWQCWLRGRDLDDAWLESMEDGWWLVGNERGDVLGAGLKRGRMLKNYLPKQRRLQEVH